MTDMDVSPDGRLVVLAAYVPESELGDQPSPWPARVIIKPVDGGPTRTVTTVEAWVSAVAWAPDGRAVYYTAADVAGNGMALHRVRIDGSDDRVLYQAPYLSDLDVKPDGTRISFRSGESVSEIWVLENTSKVLAEAGG